MSVERLKIGEQIPAVLNAFDGDTGLYPQVTLRDASNAVIGTYDIPHIADGLYRLDSQTFPATTLLTALYKVYEDAAHTTLHPDYEEKIDVFLQADAIPTAGSISIVERIEATLKQQNRIKATVITPVIRKMLILPRIKAILVQPKITGVIKQQKIIGIVRECT